MLLPLFAPGRRLQVLTVGLIIIAVLTALALVWPMLRVFVHHPIDPNEGWNALNAERALNGGRLYPATNEFFFNNYPPLSFYIVGCPGRLLGDNILAGRLVSLLSLFAVALNIVIIVRSLGGAILPAILAGLVFVATLGKEFDNYVAMNDPQMLGHAVMSAGFAVFTAAPRRSRHLVAAAAIMAFAGFIKHNIFAMPLAVTTWLAQNDRPMLWRWLAISLALVAIALTACAAAFGWNFFQQLMEPRPYHLIRDLTKLGRIQAFVIPLALWIAFVVDIRLDAREQLVTHLIVADAAAYALTQIGDFVAGNAMFDWIIGASVALGVVLSRIGETRFARRFGTERTEGLIVLALSLRLILPPPPFLLHLGASLDELRQQSAATARDIAFMRGRTGPALCEELAACYWAGHQSVFDPSNAPSAMDRGRRSLAALKGRILGGDLHLLQLHHDSPLLPVAEASSRHRRYETPASVIFYY